MESITLYFKEGASDKVYQATLDDRFTGWVVEFAYGRRGSALTLGTKTAIPLSYEKAKAVYDKLVKEKRAKGYTEGENGIPYSGGSGKDTGIRPQLLNSIDAEEVDRLLEDESFLLQPKMDGRRLLLLKEGGKVTGINRRGLECSLPETVRRSALSLEGDFLLDGELVGEVLHAFDLLERDGKSIREIGYEGRLNTLLHLLSSGLQGYIEWLTTQRSTRMKSVLFTNLKNEGAEGVVFKKRHSSYREGRPTSGGDHLKFKFVDTASCVVGKINAKRSVQMQVFDGNQWISVGNVTIPANQKVPEVGAIIECKYLYAFRGGCLFQPVYLGQRDDILPEECVLSQLKFKSEPQSVAA